MLAFDKIAPFLTNSLVLAGFAIFLFFGVLRSLLKSKVIPQLSQTHGGRIIGAFLKYGFVLALLVIVLGFANEAYKQFLSNQFKISELSRQHAAYYGGRFVSVEGIAEALSRSYKGFHWKYEYLTLALFSGEAQALREDPALRATMAAARRPYDDTVGLYDELSSDSTMHQQADDASAKSMSRLAGIARQAEDYRKLEEFVVQHQQLYKTASDLASTGRVTRADDQLRAVSTALKVTRLDQAGGYFSHLGVLALAYNDKNEALGQFRLGLTVDRDHVPLYEGLGYALWALSNDEQGALESIETGLKLIQLVGPKVSDNCQHALQDLHALVMDDGERAPFYLYRQSRVTALCVSLKDTTDRYVSYFLDSFKNLYAYCSAILQKNEDLARRYANELHEANPDDVDYAETTAFVAIRFAKTPEELINAAQCLRIISRLSHDPLSVRTATLDYDWAVRRITEDMKLSESVIPDSNETSLVRCGGGLQAAR